MVIGPTGTTGTSPPPTPAIAGPALLCSPAESSARGVGAPLTWVASSLKKAHRIQLDPVVGTWAGQESPVMCGGYGNRPLARSLSPTGYDAWTPPFAIRRAMIAQVPNSSGSRFASATHLRGTIRFCCHPALPGFGRADPNSGRMIRHRGVNLGYGYDRFSPWSVRSRNRKPLVPARGFLYVALSPGAYLHKSQECRFMWCLLMGGYRQNYLLSARCRG
jgi:hypothetical protein